MLFFDLDDTLYPRGAGVVPRVDERINRFLADRIGIASGEVDALRRGYWRDYGTTLRGLMAHHSVDPEEYLAYVHDIVIDDLIAPDVELGGLLASLPARKAVFTNGSRLHARRVLERLGVGRFFSAVYALEDLAYVPKPFPEAYSCVLGLAGIVADGTTLIDDNAKNLPPAKAIGMRTIWIGDGPACDGADAVIARVHEIERLLR